MPVFREKNMTDARAPSRLSVIPKESIIVTILFPFLQDYLDPAPLMNKDNHVLSLYPHILIFKPFPIH